MLKKIMRHCGDCERPGCRNRSFRQYRSLRSASRGFPKSIKVIGGDTEWLNGEPMTIQLWDDENGGMIKFVNAETAPDVFIKTLFDYPLKAGCRSAVVFFHNLGPDLAMIFYPIRRLMLEGQFKICTLDCETCKRRTSEDCRWLKISHEMPFKLDVKCNRIHYANLTLYNRTGGVKRRIYIRDSLAFFAKRSLDYLAGELNLGVKLPKPEGLGVKPFTEADEDFVRYALNDALIEYRLGEYLLDFHRDFDLPLACSTPNFSQKLIMKHYFPKGVTTWLPPKGVWEACCLSYHGGKNHFKVGMAVKMENVYELDINSTYPKAMKDLQPWTSGRYQKVYKLDYEHAGVYCITGVIKHCDYPIIPGHDFQYYGKNGDERVDGVWVASYEVIEALSSGELTLERCWGYVFLPDANATNPFIGFVNDIYERKRASKDTKRAFWKVLSNAGYGKTAQSTQCDNNIDRYDRIIRNNDGRIERVERTLIEHTHKAGGICHMFLATLITSAARAKIHRLEHKYQSLDTSTDSVKTTQEPDPADLGEEIGKLKIEAFGKTAYLIRNKVYVFFDGKAEPKAGRVFIEMLGNVVHSAHHGFHGTIEELITLFEQRKTAYNYDRMIKLKESYINKKIKGLKAFTMHTFENVTFNVNYYPGQVEEEKLLRRGIRPGDIPRNSKFESPEEYFDRAFIDQTLSPKEQKREESRFKTPSLKDFFGEEHA